MLPVLDGAFAHPKTSSKLLRRLAEHVLHPPDMLRAEGARRGACARGECHRPTSASSLTRDRSRRQCTPVPQSAGETLVRSATGWRRRSRADGLRTRPPEPFLPISASAGANRARGILAPSGCARAAAASASAPVRRDITMPGLRRGLAAPACDSSRPATRRAPMSRNVS